MAEGRGDEGRPVLLGIAHSHAAHAARLMLERKGLDHRVVDLLPGLHPPVVRAMGFPDGAVPALRIAGRRVQGTTAISRALDELHPDPPLFPAEAAARRAVEEAERWGHDVLQGVPRRIFRWGLRHEGGVRRWMAREVVGIPGRVVPAAGAVFTPIGWLYARISEADDGAVQEDLRRLPEHLDHCDALVADGVIGTDEVNAADCQVLASVRLLLAMEDTRPVVEGRPSAAAALRLRPDFPGPAPAFLPAAWLPHRA
ncbi:glutathione S-transferase family protein [Conexibacter sp. SYSU D00693]|uniref:glutathione S-transferase family protein n=1 Tax=Conexibacter sp. SYSU D00693 TaxID=2812560 RepID=UPI00196ADBE4|nr:glutathione S-transferase family protein [Conexibacter sp. SYSU D00693]